LTRRPGATRPRAPRAPRDPYGIGPVAGYVGPFLAFGALVGLFAGDEIVDWYLDSFA
jgi:hypothetical protein